MPHVHPGLNETAMNPIVQNSNAVIATPLRVKAKEIGFPVLHNKANFHRFWGGFLMDRRSAAGRFLLAHHERQRRQEEENICNQPESSTNAST